MRLQTVNSNILFVEVVWINRIAGGDRSLADIKSAVIGVNPVKRQQLIQVDVSLDAIVMHRRFVSRNAINLCVFSPPTTDQIKKQFAYSRCFRFS